MKRNPIEAAKKEYYDSIRFKKIKPRFFFKTCDKCHNEFKKEPMYECSFSDDYFTGVTHYVHGCTECFSSIEEFKTYCHETAIASEEEWQYHGQPCKPITRRLLLSAEKKTADSRILR